MPKTFCRGNEYQEFCQTAEAAGLKFVKRTATPDGQDLIVMEHPDAPGIGICFDVSTGAPYGRTHLWIGSALFGVADIDEAIGYVEKNAKERPGLK